jgi:hypothetical protein
VDGIELLWKAIVCECLPNDASNDKVAAHLVELKQGVPERGNGVPGLFEDGTWQAILKSKLTEVGRAYYGRGSDYIVPMPMLVFELEGLRRCWNIDREDAGHAPDSGQANWVIQAFLDIGVDEGTLLNVYYGVLTDRESRAADAAERLHYLSGIVEIVVRWIRYGDKASLKVAMQQGLRSLVDSVKANCEGLGGGANAQTVEHLTFQIRQVEAILR